MFEVTIKGETLEELSGNVNRMAATFNAGDARRTNDADDAVREELQAKRTPRKKAPVPAEPVDAENIDDGDVEAALNEPVEPMPETAKAIVDAGTGKPAAPAKSDAPIRMTFDDVKAAAAKLAAKDTPKLAAILKKYKAAKLSDVPGPDLGDFASDVMEALG